MSKNIVTIGFELASGATQFERFRSKTSLLDFDIIMFQPTIGDFISAYVDNYHGKPCLDDSLSFQLKEACEHWRREIKQAVDMGKTVLIFLTPLEEIYIDTGQRKYSGTGRSQKTTRIVDQYYNYNAIPALLSPLNAKGKAIKLAPHGAEMLAPYWEEFGSMSEYEVTLGAEVGGICLTTKNGGKPVGAIIRSKSSSGSLILLPNIDFYQDGFVGENRAWLTSAKRFAAKMISSVVALDKALRSSSEITPEPSWATDPKFALAQEITLRTELLEAERRLEDAQKQKENILERVSAAGHLRALLFEKGKPLEYAIIEDLKILGFKATQYKEDGSEFDVVFECQEGRLLGEAEGKDSKPVNIDKLRQLAMNIHEDLQREKVTAPAKGVLFGNGYRLTPPSERDFQFTEKCVTAAQSSSTALIATSDLFAAAQYLSAHHNDGFADLCQKAMLKGIGGVRLPTPPTTDQIETATVSE